MPNDLSSQFDLTEFNKQIAKFADEKFANDELCFISALGIALKEHLRQMRAATGLGLGEYVREHLSDVYDLIEVKQNTIALWPKGRPQKEAFQAVAPKSLAGSRRFLPWFWQAFSVPNAGKSRFYDPKDHMVIDFLADNESGAIEIPAKFIRSEDAPFSVKSIQDCIVEWLDENKLAADHFREAPKSAPKDQENSASLLDALIEALDKRQLQSFSMPMDVVAALAQRKA